MNGSLSSFPRSICRKLLEIGLPVQARFVGGYRPIAPLRPRFKISIYLNMSFTYKGRMKKYICILVTTGLLAACEKGAETVAPSASPSATASSETTTTSSTTNESPATESTATESSPSP